METYSIIQSGRLFVVVDQHGEAQYDSYWKADCHAWIRDYIGWDDWVKVVGLPDLP